MKISTPKELAAKHIFVIDAIQERDDQILAWIKARAGTSEDLKALVRVLKGPCVHRWEVVGENHGFPDDYRCFVCGAEQ